MNKIDRRTRFFALAVLALAALGWYVLKTNDASATHCASGNETTVCTDSGNGEGGVPNYDATNYAATQDTNFGVVPVLIPADKSTNPDVQTFTVNGVEYALEFQYPQYRPADGSLTGAMGSAGGPTAGGSATLPEVPVTQIKGIAEALIKNFEGINTSDTNPWCGLVSKDAFAASGLIDAEGNLLTADGMAKGIKVLSIDEAIAFIKELVDSRLLTEEELKNGDKTAFGIDIDKNSPDPDPDPEEPDPEPEEPEIPSCEIIRDERSDISVSSSLNAANLEGNISFPGGGHTLQTSADVNPVNVGVSHSISVSNGISGDFTLSYPDATWSVANGSGGGAISFSGGSDSGAGTLVVSPGSSACSTITVSPSFYVVTRIETGYYKFTRTVSTGKEDDPETEEDESETTETNYSCEPTLESDSKGSWGDGSWEQTDLQYVEKAKGGSASDGACLVVDKPVHPEGTLPGKTGDIAYAGETTNFEWKAGKGYSGVPTRPTIAAEPVIYSVPVEANRTTTKYGAANNRADQTLGEKTGYDPCGKYSWNISNYNGIAGIACKSLMPRWEVSAEDMAKWTTIQAVGDISSSSSETLKATAASAKTVDVSNRVGQKYCVGFGYKYQYRAFLDGKLFKQNTAAGQDSIGDEYWYDYDAYCKFVAKKPTTAFWNAGVSTGGGIQGVTAPRSVVDESLTNLGPTNSKITFGSWTEYIANSSRGGVESFGSGAALSRGVYSTNATAAAPESSYSDMTIANDSSSLGYSDIPANSTLYQRLHMYLEQLASVPTDPSPKSGATRVISVNGSYNIANDLINEGSYDRSYSNIYEIPRTIIFATGDVNISSNVNQVDAWIIADGKLNTCSDFESFNGANAINTSATVVAKSRNNAPYKTGNTACDRKLQINGPVIAKNVVLNRTGGADLYLDNPTPSNISGGASAAFSTPAEVFNLGADDYLWAYAQASRYHSSYTSGYSRELPPRY